MKKEYRLITAALPFVNNVPHLGNIVGSHLPADIFYRYCKLSNYECLFIGGTDEHGTTSEVAALKNKITPEELCDFYFKVHKDIYDWFNFNYDNFSRTSNKHHHEFVKSFFLDQGLSEEQIAVFKIKFGKLHWSNKVTRFLASFLPGRLREIFTRIQSLKGNTLKFFTNNLDSIYDMGDAELIARDTIHHLMHFVQGKRPEKRLNIFFHYLTHLIPMSLYTPPHEKEARNLANEADLGSGPLANMVQFSSNREQGNNRLKIKV